MKPKLAVAQMTSSQDIEANFNQTKQLCEEAKSLDANLICLPENFAFLGQNFLETKKMCEPLNGPLFSRYRQLASKYNLHISFGGFQEKGSEGRYYNTHVIVDNRAEIIATYRKIHLFNALLPGHDSLDESIGCDPGDNITTADVGQMRLGLSICYDLRFAELYAKLCSLHTNVLLIPAAFTVPTGKAHWEILLRARAIESQSYVLAAAQVGKHNSRRESYGHAMIVDPWGQILDKRIDKTGIALAHFDIDYLNEVRQRIPMATHRRPDIFTSDE